MKTTQEKLTKIESVIRDVCPELQELSFGCEIRVIGTNNGTDYIYKVTTDDDSRTIYYPTGWITEYFYEDDLEIIGHPIHLEHIIRAISAKLTDANVVNCHVNMYSKIVFRDDGVVGIYDYDLTKPYNRQRDEFISWLYRVLCE